MDHEYYAEKYLNMDKIIRDLQKRIDRLPGRIYENSLYTHVEYTELGMMCVSPKVDKLLEKTDEEADVIQAKINRCRYRQKHINRYLSSLTEIEREGILRGKYNEDFLDEIREIEISLAFMNGWEIPPEKVNLTNDVLTDIDLMAEVFAI